MHSRIITPKDGYWMSSLYRAKNGYFRIQYFLSGKKYIKSLRTKDEKIAGLRAKEYEAKLTQKAFQPDSQRFIEEYTAEYKDDISYRKKSTNAGDWYVIKPFLDSVRHRKTVNEITADDVRFFLRRYENKEKYKPKTFNGAVLALHRFFRPAVEREYIVKNPSKGIHHKKIPQELPRFLSDEEYLRLEEAAEGLPIWPLIVTARYTGMRLRELLNLEWPDFDWQGKVVHVLNKAKFGYTVKNYKSRVVPISDELRRKLEPYIKVEGICFPCYRGKYAGQRYQCEGPRALMRKVFQKAKITRDYRYLVHSLRHTFASRLVQQGVPIEKISDWLGHADLETTRIYARYAPSYDSDIEKLTIPSKVSMMPKPAETASAA